MRRDLEFALWLLVIGTILVALVLWIAVDLDAQERCHERGGFIEHYHGGWRCAEPRAR